MNTASPETILRACLVIQLGVISMNVNYKESRPAAGSGWTAIRVLAILARGLAVLICLPALLLLLPGLVAVSVGITDTSDWENSMLGVVLLSVSLLGMANVLLLTVGKPGVIRGFRIPPWVRRVVLLINLLLFAGVLLATAISADSFVSLLAPFPVGLWAVVGALLSAILLFADGRTGSK